MEARDVPMTTESSPNKTDSRVVGTDDGVVPKVEKPNKHTRSQSALCSLARFLVSRLSNCARGRRMNSSKDKVRPPISPSLGSEKKPLCAEESPSTPKKSGNTPSRTGSKRKKSSKVQKHSVTMRRWWRGVVKKPPTIIRTKRVKPAPAVKKQPKVQLVAFQTPDSKTSRLAFLPGPDSAKSGTSSEKSLVRGGSPSTSTSTPGSSPFNNEDSNSDWTDEDALVTDPFKPVTKVKLMTEGDVKIRKHFRNTKYTFPKSVWAKIIARWERHHIVLDETLSISSTGPTGTDSTVIRYSVIEEVVGVEKSSPGWTSSMRKKFLIRLQTHDTVFFMKFPSRYVRDQWLRSINFRRAMYKSQQILNSSAKPEVKCREVKNMIRQVLSTTIEEELTMVSFTINCLAPMLPPEMEDDVLLLLGPLLGTTTPSKLMCTYLSDYCRRNSHSELIGEVMSPVIEWILKRNADFGKHSYMRKLVKDFFGSLFYQPGGQTKISEFISRLHGPSSKCPHKRVLANLVAVCLASLHLAFTRNRDWDVDEPQPLPPPVKGIKARWHKLNFSMFILGKISTFLDWRVQMGQILQSVPFTKSAVASPAFRQRFKDIMSDLATDTRCEAHRLLVGLREGKEGWFDLYSPELCPEPDEELEKLWVTMLSTLIYCHCRRKKFIRTLGPYTHTLKNLALRGVMVAQETICLMLECNVIQPSEDKFDAVVIMESTESGRRVYHQFLERQSHLEELMNRPGPKLVSLPSKSTDEDVAQLVSRFLNIESLSLAFTKVTSACAGDLCKLKSLQSLNLWATRFDDYGLEMLCENLENLQELILCETAVTDVGLQCLSSLKCLRRLNLNSTTLSESNCQFLINSLPTLEKLDVRYTDAWTK